MYDITNKSEILHRMPAVNRLSGRSRAWIYRAIQSGDFPKPVRLGLRAVGWRDSDIRAWQDGLIVGVRSAGSAE